MKRNQMNGGNKSLRVFDSHVSSMVTIVHYSNLCPKKSDKVTTDKNLNTMVQLQQKGSILQ